LVKGQDLAKLLVEENCKVLGINFVLEISAEKNPQEPSQTSVEKNPQEPSSSTQSTPIHIYEKFLLSE